MIACVTQIRCLHRLHTGSIKQAQIMLSLTKLKTHLKRPLLIAGDSLRANRSNRIHDYVDGPEGLLKVAFQAPCAPGFETVKYLCAWLKRHALANFRRGDLRQLPFTGRNRLKSTCLSPNMIVACSEPAELWLDHELGVAQQRI